MPNASVEVVRLVAEIERFCAEPPHQSGEDLGADLIELRRGMNVLELKFSRMSAEFATTDQYDAEGCLSPIHWIRVNCYMTSGAAADRVAVGEQVANVPASAEAMAGGEIGFPHLALIAREASALAESGATRPFDETRLLNKARDFTVGRFRNFCHHERHANDPSGYAAEQAEAVQARTLSLTTGEGGMLWIRGVLDPEGGALVRTALEPLTKHNGRGDDRKRDRRLADGLVELASHWLDGASARSARPHLQVTTTLETLLQRCGAPAGDLELSLPISAAAVERLACDCSVTRVLLSADSLVIDVGRTTRKIPPATGRALRVRDRGCRWPGCERPASWTSAHHLKHWVRGGPTDLGNLVLLCHRHHWMVHEGKWQMVMAEGGDVLTLPPQLDTTFTNLARGPGIDSAA
jgi:hypothetical protein